MLYSEKAKFLFISVPKTGSTSIQKQLVQLGIGKQNVLEIDGKEVVVHDHISALDLKNIFGQKWSEIYKVAYVRNPWDRVHSGYYYNKQGLVNRYKNKHYKPKHYRVKKLLSKWIPFRLWCLFYPTKPCSWFLNDSTGNLLVDCVYTFENFDKSFFQLCDKLGLEQLVPGERNVSIKKSGYAEAYGVVSRTVVGQRLKQDVMQFGYRFGERQLDVEIR
jgi:hypothetical protein